MSNVGDGDREGSGFARVRKANEGAAFMFDCQREREQVVRHMFIEMHSDLAGVSLDADYMARQFAESA